MALRWKEYVELADALNKAYPDQTLADMEDAELIRLVKALPDFHDDSEPDETTLMAVMARWISVAYPED